MQQPDWAANADKFTRALKWVTDQVSAGALKEVTEEAVKERYVALGGLVSEVKVRADAADLALEDMTVPALKKRAAAANIDISGISTKPELVAAIKEVEDAE